MKTPNKALGRALVMGRLRLAVEVGREIRSFEIAKKLGVSSGFMSSLEQGKKIPSLEMLAKMIRLYPKGTADEIHAALKLR